MPLELTLMDLRLRRRSMLWYAVGMAVYAFVIVAMYPSMKSDSSLSDFLEGNETAAALFGVSGSLTSPVGWTNGNLYANFLPLLVLLLTIGYGANAIAGQSEEGVLGMVASLPVSRGRLILEKTVTLVVVALPLAIATMAVVLIGPRYELDLGIWPVIGTTLTVVLLGIDFGLFALAIGAVTGRRGIALATASVVAVAAYLISSLAPVISWAHRIRYISPFYWAVGDNQLGSGPSATAILVLAGIAVVLLAAALVAIRRLDIP
ncbi:ABC transporter permease [Streptomyces pluripotens]|uniref:ABC transporter permease n=1 Tax=Streptomyces pluripotens TaxID=1355015 RepID=A0A221NS34_9ACTN|nr:MULTISPECIES: ABC transporter permease subunit [Streptomyces]ASN22787.1 ABC transporter permease [Streptomyces pluripotens]KIE25423.1 ABC transporter permease [Streptomyces sp. MUSC 125]MCH0558176.1 ABC transporter permease subunit [Streptomyces sp. MUM 16J]